MGGALTHPSSNSQLSGRKLQLCNASLDKSCPVPVIVNSDIVDNIMKDTASNVSVPVADFDDSTVEEFGNSPADTVKISGPVHKASNVSSSDQYGSSYQNEVETAFVNGHSSSSITDIYEYSEYVGDSCDDLDEISDQNEIKSSDLYTDMSKHFSGAEKLESLDEVPVFPLAVDASGQLNMAIPAESLVESTSVKLVSALKGSRSQQGLPVGKLSVKWAPDVYDPPVTSQSHTVKSHRRRTKSTKDYSKHRNGKSKSLRSASGEKKHASRRNSNLVDSRTARYEAAKGVKVYDSSSLPTVPVLDYTAELKCSANVCMESLSHLNLSIAEVS